MMKISDEDRFLLKKDPKSFLSQGFRTRERIDLLENRIFQLNELVTSTTAPLKDVAVYSSMPSNKQEKYILQIIELQETLKKEISQLVEQQRLADWIIKTYAKPGNEQLVLTARYLNYLSIEDIAAKLHYSYRWVLAIQTRALKRVKRAC